MMSVNELFSERTPVKCYPELEEHLRSFTSLVVFSSLLFGEFFSNRLHGCLKLQMVPTPDLYCPSSCISSLSLIYELGRRDWQ